MATVATVAPAYAASCQPETTTTLWGTSSYSRTSSSSGTYSTESSTPSGSGLTIDIDSVFGSNTQPGDQFRRTNNNLVGITEARAGGTENVLAVHQSPISDYRKVNTMSRDNSQSITFNFSTPVTDLSFSILDIDSAAWDFRDAIAVVASEGTVTASVEDPNYLYASGGIVYARYTDDTLDKVTDSIGNAHFQVTGTVSSLTITLYNATSSYDSTIDGDHVIFVSPLTFSYSPC